VIVPDHVPEPPAQQQTPGVERALLAPVPELDRRPGSDGGADRRELGPFGDGHRHRWALVAQRAAELPQRLLAGVGVRGRDGDLQGTHLVVRQIEVGQFVRPPIDPIAGLPRVRTAGEDLGLDRHADVAQRRLVAFECTTASLVALGILAGEFGGDLHETERFSRLEQQREQVGEALDPVDHQPTTLPVAQDTTGDAARDASDQSCNDLVCRNSSMP
jgi:hypothetical protein